MKKFFIIAAVAAASIFGLVKANDVNVTNQFNALQLANVELLAEGEDRERIMYNEEWGPGEEVVVYEHGNWVTYRKYWVSCPEGSSNYVCTPGWRLL